MCTLLRSGDGVQLLLLQKKCINVGNVSFCVAAVSCERQKTFSLSLRQQKISFYSRKTRNVACVNKTDYQLNEFMVCVRTKATFFSLLKLLVRKTVREKGIILVVTCWKVNDILIVIDEYTSTKPLRGHSNNLWHFFGTSLTFPAPCDI